MANSLQMLARTRTAARPLARGLVYQTATRSFVQSSRLRVSSQAAIDDPGMNGGYINPVPVKRSLRDPYADWWDKQERRNYGEPIHEDNDILGMFTTEPYTHFTAGWGAVLMGCFITAFGTVCGVCYVFHPEKPAVPRTFPGGLDRELGGPSALSALSDADNPE
ncbi:NADH-ubiquinone oxidoreductase kd subunit [Trichodelitschia bisporula]|uniref:NADH-ubiquinone oxidoreductase kd subunit n=1 Tax=Trichodelitschia bisporula TaxID=703511 RepID=A0A6G1I0P4_9PEZI|nr:NADH-ubiquinone oxidoreductase kd subunit [Trichodelitschia bisporula]